jgi:hypothetical protein
VVSALQLQQLLQQISWLWLDPPGTSGVARRSSCVGIVELFESNHSQLEIVTSSGRGASLCRSKSKEGEGGR